jgi:hypothetical protein
VTFDLASPQAAAWNYFEDGTRQFLESLDLRRDATPNEDERLDPGVVWGYHDPGHRRRYVHLDWVDYYRCWPRAQVTDAFVDDVGVNGIQQPLVIYSNGSHGLLGEGNHRIAAARRLGLERIPIVIVPDRLTLPEGMGQEHLRRLDPRTAAALAGVAQLHWRSNRHAISTNSVGTTVHVFCRCGAQWKRPKEMTGQQ